MTAPAHLLLEALDLRGLAAWSVGDVANMNTAELLALTYDNGEADPALGVLESLSTDLQTLGLALANPDQDLPREQVLELLHRYSLVARVAGELHRREIAAARGT